MINNRQNGRRRGRGGAPRQNGGNGQSGNRIDNRARGNAAQLHEKYKTLARDAQMQGDRVMTEYYLQFADHYFRVLSENRPRFEEQQQRRDRFESQDFEDENDGESEGETSGQNSRGDDRQAADRHPGDRQSGDRQREGRDRDYREYREPRAQRDRDGEPRPARQPREPRQPREQLERGQVEEAQPAPETFAFEEPQTSVETPADAEPAKEAPRRRGRPRRVVEQAAETDTSERIEVDRLPPSLALENGSEPAAAEAEEKPKRRTRRPRAESAAAEA